MPLSNLETFSARAFVRHQRFVRLHDRELSSSADRLACLISMTSDDSARQDIAIEHVGAPASIRLMPFEQPWRTQSGRPWTLDGPRSGC
jgi:hypothetical protein